MRMSEKSLGRVHSFQSLGTLDGPGVRFVVFLQGCNLRCSCCHNPDTWAVDGGTLYTAEQVVTKAERFSSYFGEKGGITLSGGEPLLQAEFASEIFSLCKDKGINTCLDTSGSILSPSVKKLLDLTDRILLDIKYVEDEKYRKYVGCSIDKVIEFLDLANEKGIPTTLRQVIIPTVNDTDREIEKQCGCSIKELIEAKGEKYFRDLETKVIRDVSSRCSQILSTGGGAILRKKNLRYLKQNGKLFYLDAPLSRLCATEDRPLSNTEDKLRALYHQRLPLYRESADVTVPDGKSPAEEAEFILTKRLELSL